MSRWDHFSAAGERWRADAAMRMRRVLTDHPHDAEAYINKRIAFAKFGTFERRRWKYIKTLISRQLRT
jgi:hypothetical protein